MWVIVRYSPGRRDEAELLVSEARRLGLDAGMVEVDECRYCLLEVETPIGNARGLADGMELIETAARVRERLLAAAADP